MKPNPQLKQFLLPYDLRIRELLLDLRAIIIKWVPEANELIWDNYNALALAYSKSQKLADAFCHLAVYPDHINFGFNRGVELSKTETHLEGTGRLIRHLKVKDLEKFPEDDVKRLVLEAVMISVNRNENLKNNTAIGVSKVMSISPKKIRPKD